MTSCCCTDAKGAALMQSLESGEEPSPTYQYSGELQPEAKIFGRTWVNCVSFLAFVVNVVVTYVSLTGIFGETNQALSAKYQTLITPKGYAFAIWGVIFIWEGIWSIWQLCPPVAGSAAARTVALWWWATCAFQCAWTVTFAQEMIPIATVMMLCILGSLIAAVWSLDCLSLSWCDYFLQRVPFAIHLGWIVCAAAVNVNVWLDSRMSPPNTLLWAAIASLVAIVLMSGLAVSCFARTAEPILGLVAAWALIAVGVELSDPVLLNDPNRFNPYMWPEETLAAVRMGAFIAAGVACGFSLVGVVRRTCGCCL